MQKKDKFTKNNISITHPYLIKEWDFDKNKINPNELSAGSNKRAWWKCDKGHSWNTSICHRAIRNTGCPICVGRKVLKGYNDLSTTHHSLVSEWNYDKNHISPSEVVAGSNKKVWWRCGEGHEWQTAVCMRTINNTGCPYCAGQKILKGFNDLATRYPNISKEWDFEKNKLMPCDVMPGTSKKVWWKCINGHSWQASILNRTNKGNGCPVCSGRKILKGFNDLATTHPSLAKEWNYEENNITPYEVGSGSHKKAMWKCDKGHSWYAVIYSRCSGGKGCPYCAGQKRLKGFNDLATTHPQLVSEWHPTKNGDTTPDMVGANDKTDYWWICDKGHEWQARPHNRTMNNTGCPYCSGRLAVKGENDLATTNPSLATEWHPTKNDCSPTDFPFMSGKKVWWMCNEGHEWQAAISTRARSGCPYCAGKRPIVGKTDLATLMPEIAEEWNYEKNRGKTPQMFTKNSNQKVWWKCNLEHEWRTAICSRTGIGNGCPECAKNRRKY